MPKNKAAVYLLTFVVSFSLLAAFTTEKIQAASNESWAIYWYLCGSDLETDTYAATVDILEMCDVDLPDNVTVVIQTGGAKSWYEEGFIDAKAMYRLVYNSEGLSLADAVENQSMGDPDTLIEFLDFSFTNYPADKTMLILWNHGGGTGAGICYDELFDFDYLTLTELRFALYMACEPDRMFDIIGFDACLMASVDVAYAIGGYANYMVASQETEPSLGWSYDGWLKALSKNPGMDAEELAIAICDTYYAACEEEGLHEDATLSVLDLHYLDNFIWALDWFGYEGVLTAQNNNAGSFFADYARGAKSVDSYGGGEYEMGDIIGLANANKDLFPNSSQEVINRAKDLVIYNVTGPYRSGSNGISVYYPYTRAEGQYENFYESSASDALRFMYQLQVTGQFDPEVWSTYIEWQKYYDYYANDKYQIYGSFEEYIEEVGEGKIDSSDIWAEDDSYAEFLEILSSFEEEELMEFLAGLGIEFEDVSEYYLEDWPIDIYEDEYGITYACLDIGGDAASLLQRVTFMLAYFGEEEEIIVLGEDFDIDCDWYEGFFADNFRGVWGSIDDCIVTMEVISITDDYIMYNVPVLINGIFCDLSVAYVYEDEEYVILSAAPVNESGIPSKEKILLTPGDEITTLMMLFSEESEGDYYEWETLIVTKNTSFHEIELPDGVYAFMYLMTDYADNVYYSQIAGILIEDGFIEMVSLED